MSHNYGRCHLHLILESDTTADSIISTDEATNRQIDRKIEIQNDRKKDRYIFIKTELHTDRHIERQTDRKINRKREREIDREYTLYIDMCTYTYMNRYKIRQVNNECLQIDR